MDHSENEGEERGIEKYNREDATHMLSCRHAFDQKSGYDYYMNCIILKEMPDNRLKILVFGERYWRHYKDKRKIRYVDKFRVSPIHKGVKR